jgi:hypothetical protein
MARQTRSLAQRQAGQDWLLACAHNPTTVARDWAADALSPIASGEHWRVVEARLLPSIQAMKRVGANRLGPVLADPELETAWWLVPSDVGDQLDDVRQLKVMPPGWPLSCPPVLYPVAGRVWLERPDGAGRLTDPIVLGAAFGPGGRLPAEAFG